MKKLILAAVAAVCVLAAQTLAPTSASAQGYDDGYQRRPSYGNEYRRPYGERPAYGRRYDGCGALIRATGRGFLTGFASRNAAINSWKREAFSVYKRDYSWERASGKSISCEPYGVTQRCTAFRSPLLVISMPVRFSKRTGTTSEPVMERVVSQVRIAPLS